MSDYSMADISSLLQSIGQDNSIVAKNSTSRKNNIDLDMTDFLQLMVVQLQSQTIDDSMDTSEMMNQLVQMQMVTAITNMTETNIMTYASSLVGKEVTIGIVEDNKLIERVVTVTGTAMSNGSQVIFGSDGETYNLNQIMAVGKMPDIEGVTKPEDSAESGSGDTTTVPDVTNPGTTNPAPSVTDPGTTGSEVTGSSGTDGSQQAGAESGAGSVENGSNPEYDGTQGAPVEG